MLSKYVKLKPAGSKADSKQRINGFPVEWFDEWQKNDLELKEFFRLTYTVSYTKETWVERIESVSCLQDWKKGLGKRHFRI